MAVIAESAEIVKAAVTIMYCKTVVTKIIEAAFIAQSTAIVKVGVTVNHL